MGKDTSRKEIQTAHFIVLWLIKYSQGKKNRYSRKCHGWFFEWVHGRMKSPVVSWLSYRELSGKQVYQESNHLKQLLPCPVSLTAPLWSYFQGRQYSLEQAC